MMKILSHNYIDLGFHTNDDDDYDQIQMNSEKK